MFAPHHLPFLIKYFDGIDAFVARKMSRPAPPGETTLTEEFCAMMDAGQADAARASPLARNLVEDIGPERVLLSQESLSEVMEALDELGERTRDIFLLCRLDKMKQRDIATVYGLTVSAVEKHIAKAGLHLTRRFGKR